MKVTVIPSVTGVLGTNSKRLVKATRRLGNKTISGDYPDKSYNKIGQNHESSPGNFKKLTLTQTHLAVPKIRSDKLPGKQPECRIRERKWRATQHFPPTRELMSVKLHFLQSQLDYFPKKCGDLSEEQGERFYPDIDMLKERDHGR